MSRSAEWQRYIPSILIFALALLLTSSYALIAQQSPRATAKHVTVRVDGGERTVSTTAATVQDVLDQEGIELIQHDRTEPALDAAITDGMTVVVTRVRMEIVTERIPVEPPVTVKYNNRVAVPIVLDPGEPGVAEQKHIMWKKDGVISVEWRQGYKVVTEPKPKVVLRGKSQPSRSGSTARKSFIVTATAYEPGPRSCGKYATGYTAIGLKAERGIIAVDPKVIPLGSRVYVEGYGEAIAGDVGGAIKGNRIDVCFPTVRECLQWGRRKVRVTILN